MDGFKLCSEPARSSSGGGDFRAAIDRAGACRIGILPLRHLARHREKLEFMSNPAHFHQVTAGGHGNACRREPARWLGSVAAGETLRCRREVSASSFCPSRRANASALEGLLEAAHHADGPRFSTGSWPDGRWGTPPTKSQQESARGWAGHNNQSPGRRSPSEPRDWRAREWSTSPI